MLKFNNNHIFTGYLKQLLASFNLPKYRVYTKEQQKYFNEYNAELNVIPTILSENNMYPEDMRYTAYIKDDIIQQYVVDSNGNGAWRKTNLHYHDNKEEINYTKRFQIKNNIYDSYTHEYLGQYLRFLRDYYDLNLMPLYNCFSNNLCSNLELKFDIYSPSLLSMTNRNNLNELNINKKSVVFESKDKSSKIYMVPVKLFKKYTIAIDSESPIELCCGFYKSYFNNKPKLKSLSALTYMRLSQTSFNKPFIFEKLTEECLGSHLVNILDLSQYEEDLKLFIKLPQSNNSSITILEGDYTGYNDRLLTPNGKILQNRTVINFDTANNNKLESRTFEPITNLQLLQLNTRVSYPFADRLMEYLTGNVVDKLDNIPDNIIRAQRILHNNNINGSGAVFVPIIEGIWDQRTQMYAYDYMTNPANTQLNINNIHDIFGYIDKDSETSIYRTIPSKNVKVSIAKADLYSELYNNQYSDHTNNV